MSDDNDGMVYSRPGGMAPSEQAKIRRRLGGGTTPNASGARQEAPAILAGSEPSRELQQPKLTPEEEAIAAANREARDKIEAGADPVNGEVDPLDVPDLEEVRRMASAGEPLIQVPAADGTPGTPATDSLLE
jgi:hypothetical protein